MFFPIIAPDGTEVFPIHDNGEEARWAMGKDGVAKQIAAGTLVWKKRMRNGVECWEPYTREYAPDTPTRPYPSIWSDLPTMRQAKAVLRKVFQTTDLFDTPKPSELIERILYMLGDINVKRVINGYGEGKKAVEGSGGNFSYYELGPVLLLSDGNLNEEVGVEKIREYVYYMETKETLPTEQSKCDSYFMGLCRNTAYYFYYERESVTTLDYSFLASIQTKAEGYTIYADLCTIPQETLRKHNIIFKKIPRDIARL